MNSGAVKSTGGTVQNNVPYGPSTFEDSRRASSSISQFSGDESRRLFNSGVKVPKSTIEDGHLGVITYGSVVFQLKDANLEANGTCDFVFRALQVICKTKVVTVCLMILFTFPLLMLTFGWKFMNDCPKGTNIPIYMVIGGMFGMILLLLIIYSQIGSRRQDVMMVPAPRPQISLRKVMVVILSIFLTIWFVMGNYWILSISWPHFEYRTFSPDTYCHKFLYIFSLVHLGVVYIVIGITLLGMIGLASVRLLACPLPQRYK